MEPPAEEPLAEEPLAEEPLADVDAVIWAVEQHPRTRTAMAALARFAGPLDEDELRHRVDRASRVIPRLRQRVVRDRSGLAPPRWSLDPEFRLDAHLKSEPLPNGDGPLMDVVRDHAARPFDQDRPLWEFVHFRDDQAGDALLLKCHHAVSDGVRGAELMLELFDLDRTPAPDRSVLPPEPAPPDPAALEAEPNPILAAVRQDVAKLLGLADRAARAIDDAGGEVDVAGLAQQIGASLGSAIRLFAPGSTPRAVPTTRSVGLDLRECSVPLDDLRRAGARAGGTINDAFVAATTLAISDYFDTRTPLRVSIPINTRADRSGVGNHWAPGRIDVRTHGASVDELVADIRRHVGRMRSEPAHALLAPAAGALRRLPAPAIAAAYTSLTSTFDIAASNVPGSPVPLYLCGEEVTALIPFGPLSGCAINTTLLSHADHAHIGIASDPAAVADPDRLQQSLGLALERVVTGS